MSRDQLSNFNSENPVANFLSEHNSHYDNGSIFAESISPIAKSSVRLKVLERLLEQIAEQDLLGKSYVDDYLRHKYRRNCKANTLKQSAISLIQFLSFFANRGNTVLEQLNREEIEAFVEALQDRGRKPSTVNTRLRNVYAFIRFLIIEYKGFDYGLMERKVKIKMPDGWLLQLYGGCDTMISIQNIVFILDVV